MTLPDELRRVVTVGTMHMDGLPQTISLVDAVIGRVEGRLEAQILLKIAGLGLRRQAGYMESKDHRPLEPACPPDERRVISPKSLRHLTTMMRGKAIPDKTLPENERELSEKIQGKLTYAELLPEWCIHAALLNLRVPEEWLADILQFGQNQKSTRLHQHLLPLLGKRGKWLAQAINNQNWKWALTTTEADPKSLLQTERWREAEIIEALSTKSLDLRGYQHPGISSLQTYKAPWSKVLADVFVNAMEFGNVMASPPTSIILSVLDQCAYYYPLTDTHTVRLLNFMGRGGEGWQNKMRELRDKFAFRHDILAELYATAES